MWGGGSSTQETVLKEAALHSGGAFFTSNTANAIKTKDYIREAPIIAFRKNLYGQHHLRFPLDSHVTGLHITLSASVQSAQLTTPEGEGA